MSETPTDIGFAFTPGSSVLVQRIVVFYLDTEPGGITSTASLIDGADDIRTAVSGYDPAADTRSLVTFPTGFQPEYAIALRQNDVTLFGLVENGSHTSLETGVTTEPTLGTAGFSVARGLVGLTGSPEFRFVATYVAASALRSDEAIGPLVYNGATRTSFDPVSYSGWESFGESLPVELASLTASHRGDYVQLEWFTAAERGVRDFTLERSLDLDAWTAVHQTPAMAREGDGASYHFDDYNVTGPLAYYRLVSRDLDGTRQYSHAVVANAPRQVATSLVVGPTPLRRR